MLWVENLIYNPKLKKEYFEYLRTDIHSKKKVKRYQERRCEQNFDLKSSELLKSDTWIENLNAMFYR